MRGKQLRVILLQEHKELVKDAESGVLSKIVLEMTDRALAGDMQSMTWVLNRAYPLPKDTPAPLPELDLMLTMSEQIDYILKSLADGTLTPTEANAYATIIERKAKIVEIDDIVRDVSEIKERLNAA